MKTDLEKIKIGFAFMDNSRADEVSQDFGFSYWIFRWEDSFGVGIEIANDLKFSEVFATARLFTDRIFIKSEGEDKNFLLLTSSDEFSRNEFAKVCESFIELGSDNQQRLILMKDPSIWWKTWRSLLGNAIRDRKPYDIIGELYIYKLLLELDIKKISWNGPKKSSHDIESEYIDYEIKSTIRRYDNSVTISGQHQLTVSPNKKFYLVFIRFESSTSSGISIDSVIDEITNLGISKKEIERKLSALGFEEGRTSRKEKYILHGTPKLFLVDSGFPKITESSFVGGSLPLGITRITYEVDLSNLKSIEFSEHLDLK
ncbi:MAG: PD-(D/E)XK motif protein [Clostridia bacterium]|jgi:hypothetical protein